MQRKSCHNYQLLLMVAFIFNRPNFLVIPSSILLLLYSKQITGTVSRRSRTPNHPYSMNAIDNLAKRMSKPSVTRVPAHCQAPSTLSVMCGTFTEHSLEKNEIMSGMYDSVINSGL